MHHDNNTITEGVVQICIFNTTADLILWAWFCSQCEHQSLLITVQSYRHWWTVTFEIVILSLLLKSFYVHWQVIVFIIDRLYACHLHKMLGSTLFYTCSKYVKICILIDRIFRKSFENTLVFTVLKSVTDLFCIICFHSALYWYWLSIHCYLCSC